MVSKYNVQDSKVYIKDTDVPKNKLNIETSIQIHELEQENYLKDCENISKEEFTKKLAYFKCEINALHPFYELNGRITRLFFDMIALFNGYKYIDYSVITPKEYIDAAIECVQFADSENMGKIILNGLKK